MAWLRPARALFTHCGSASSGRAIDTMSAPPVASTASATSGMLMRLLATSGTRHMGFQLGGHPGERRARHRRGDGGDARLVPADAAVDDRGAGGFHRLGLGDDRVPVVAAFDQVEQRQPVDQDEIRPAGLAHATHDFDGEAHPPCRVAAPAVAAAVHPRRGELVQQIAFRPHDLDAVIAGLAREHRGGGEIADLALDAARRQRARGERIDRRLQSGWCHRQRMVGVASGVQQLQAELAVLGVHRRGHLAVPAHVPGQGQAPGERLEPADDIRREAARDHQPDTALGAFCKIGRKLGEIVGMVFQPGVHRAHQDAVAQGGETQVERGEKVREGGRHHGSIPSGMVGRMRESGAGGVRGADFARV